MQATTVNFKLIKKIKDDRFDEEGLHHYRLLVQIGVKDLQVGIIDDDQNRMLFLEDYALGDISTHQELLDIVKSLFEAHSLLLAGFWKEVKISFKNNKFAQVPASLFVEEAAADYLKMNAQVDESREAILFCKNRRADAITVFAVQQELFNWLKGIYANTTFSYYHQSAAIAEGVLTQSLNEPGNPLYIYVDRFKLHIISARQGKLIYYNQFVIKQFSDYVKYIMLVLKGLNMDQLSSQVILWGYIGKNSPHYQEFVKYIRNVVFGGRPSYLKFGYLFDEVQEHHFFDLYSLDLLKS